jgi:hypothetical protein
MISRLLGGKSKGNELMLAGIFLLLLSNYLQPLEFASFNSANTILWLGLLTFLYGLATFTNENNGKDKKSDSVARKKYKKHKSSKKS